MATQPGHQVLVYKQKLLRISGDTFLPNRDAREFASSEFSPKDERSSDPVLAVGLASPIRPESESGRGSTVIAAGNKSRLSKSTGTLQTWQSV